MASEQLVAGTVLRVRLAVVIEASTVLKYQQLICKAEGTLLKSEGLETLLDLNGVVIAQERGYWVKFEAHRVALTEHIPHGISYSLTLHDNYNQRIMGFDNAHAPKGGRRRRYQGQIVEYDHYHRNLTCKGVSYEFDSPAQLVEDFWSAVDNALRSCNLIK